MDVKKANESNCRFFSFGVGYDVNTILLDKIASSNRGYSEYIKPGEEMEMKISSFYRKISEPLLSDVELAISKVETISLYPKELPDIFRGSQLMVVGKYKGSGASAIKLTGKKGKSSLTETYESSFPEVNAKNDFIPQLWAVRRIGYLLDAIRSEGERNELVEEVVKLSKLYGIITPYTSFLVTEPDEKERRLYQGVPPPVRSAAPHDLIPEAASRASGKEAVRASEEIGDYQKADLPSTEAAQVKRMFGKAFFLRSGIWTDSEYKGTEKIIKVKFGSDEYFTLCQDKKLARFFSIGKRVLVKYEHKVYLVEPEK